MICKKVTYSHTLTCFKSGCSIPVTRGRMNTRIFNRDRGLNTCKASPLEKIMPLFTVGYLSRLYASDLGVARSYNNKVRIRTRKIVLRTLCIRAPENRGVILNEQSVFPV